MRIKLTQDGLDKMQKELKHLKEVKRPKVIHDIAVAREKGDLKENAEYDAAREAQAFLEKRIQELDNQLAQVELIDHHAIDASKAYLGAMIQLKDLKTKKEISYMLVSKEEADLKSKKISLDSPVGRALLGKGIGEIVQVTIPAGTLRYEILHISR